MCPASGKSTFDGNPNTSPAVTVPYRPGDDDFNGIALENDPVEPPDPQTMPTAPLLNSHSAEIVKLRELIHSAAVSVIFSGGNPAIDSFTAGPSAFTQASPTATFSVARHGGGAGAGDIDVTWPADSLPSAATKPSVSLNGTTPGIVCVSPITNGVRVVAQDHTGTAADLPFTVIIR